jgi:hypothetical protein|tara:strand:- start:27129 stop:27884 length:756 start_codon:yes stop_codon:yes gene_type:complete
VRNIKEQLFLSKALFCYLVALKILLLGCSDTAITAEEVVMKSIENHGGLTSWQRVKQLSFVKETTLFFEDGTVENKINQLQSFHLKTNFSGSIKWQENEKNIVISFNDNEISKIINDSLVTSFIELEEARNSFFAAQYVVGQPFTLLGKGTKLILKDNVFIGDIKTYAVNVIYPNDTNMSDKWTYFFDSHTFEMVANKVELSNHTSWIDNITYDESSGIKFNAHRKSYRLNSLGEKSYLRAEYFYRNFKIN